MLDDAVLMILFEFYSRINPPSKPGLQIHSQGYQIDKINHYTYLNMHTDFCAITLC